MGSPLRVYTGSGIQVSLYDATNGLAYLGWIEEGADFSDESQNTILSTGSLFELSKLAKFQIPILQTDAAKLAILTARRGYAQEVYFIGLDFALKISNVFISVNMARGFKPGTGHKYLLTGQTGDKSQAVFMTNILGVYGSMDTAVANICTGWTNDGGTSPTNPASFLGGGHGNCQRITFTDATDFMYCLIRFPLDALSIKITFSANFHNYTANTRSITMGFRTKNAAGTVLDTNTKVESFTSAQEKIVSNEITFLPTALVQSIEAFVSGGAAGSIDIAWDEAQLEMGEYTAWKNG